MTDITELAEAVNDLRQELFVFEVAVFAAMRQSNVGKRSKMQPPLRGAWRKTAYETKSLYQPR